jgi:hypothetical protein
VKLKLGDTVLVVGERRTSNVRAILTSMHGVLLETRIGIRSPIATFALSLRILRALREVSGKLKGPCPGAYSTHRVSRIRIEVIFMRFRGPEALNGQLTYYCGCLRFNLGMTRLNPCAVIAGGTGRRSG